MGRNLSLRTRRNLVRGIGARVGRAWATRKTTGIGNRATLTTALTGTNNDLTLLAKTPGTGGNSTTFRIVVAGASTPLSVSVAGSAITVNSATTAGSAASSTAADIVKAINFSATAKALVWAQLAPANDGTGVVTALGATSLTGAA